MITWNRGESALGSGLKREAVLTVGTETSDYIARIQLHVCQR